VSEDPYVDPRDAELETLRAQVESMAATAKPATQLPQFGGVASPVTEAQPAVSEEGGYVAAKPMLTTGAHGPIVAELAELLHDAGFPNQVHAGQVAPILDDTLMLLVRAFQAREGIDPSAPQDGAAPLIPRSHGGIVDAKTWEALLGDVAAVFQRYPFHKAPVAA
jgi:peptidoglycan hydrolase-like protein with peptidoglycan-binding domain